MFFSAWSFICVLRLLIGKECSEPRGGGEMNSVGNPTVYPRGERYQYYTNIAWLFCVNGAVYQVDYRQTIESADHSSSPPLSDVNFPFPFRL